MQRVIVDVRDLGCNLDMAWARRRAISLSLSPSLFLFLSSRLIFCVCFWWLWSFGLSFRCVFWVWFFGGYGVSLSHGLDQLSNGEW